MIGARHFGEFPTVRCDERIGNVSATDIVGYTYNADQYCPDCILKPEQIGFAFSVEAVLDVVARFMDIDRYDEKTFDSGTFPKVIFESQIEDDERCGKCNNRLVWYNL